MRKIIFWSVLSVWLVSTLLFFIVLPVTNALAFESSVWLTRDEYQNVTFPTNRFITPQGNIASAVSDTDEKYIDLKLFGIIPIKRVKVDILPFERLNAGGVPVGFVAKTDGVIVIEDSAVSDLRKGDIITSLNGNAVDSIEDFSDLLGDSGNSGKIDITFRRAGKPHNTNIEYGKLSDSRTLGLWLKDETSGVGMLTYINPENNNFSALGHKLSDSETGTSVDVRGGDVYCCNVLGLEKSVGRRVGEFKSALKSSAGKQGSVISSNEGGIFGCLNADSEFISIANKSFPVGSRYSVRPGSAKIRTCLDGETIEEFDIEIIKAHYQKNKGTKSMVVRITDKDLLSRTGGIIHGMSGSPIIQNGKLVGALTHVMVSDTTKGYGIYIDFVMP